MMKGFMATGVTEMAKKPLTSTIATFPKEGKNIINLGINPDC